MSLEQAMTLRVRFGLGQHSHGISGREILTQTERGLEQDHLNDEKL